MRVRSRKGPMEIAVENFEGIRAYFSDYFSVLPTSIEEYGAFNISVLNDLPLFIDPFLLFNSKKSEYRDLHDSMIRYLRFLRDKSAGGAIDQGLIQAWYRFPEVRQNWLGFSIKGNRGSGLGRNFARELHGNLHRIFGDFGEETVTRGSHLEKLCLFTDGVGKDNISDFTTNLIKDYLLEYTQLFAQKHIHKQFRRRVWVSRVRFNYELEVWEGSFYDLPSLDDDYVLLTPKDMLAKDDTWINRSDLIEEFDEVPSAIPNDELRAQINNYLARQLPKKPTNKDRRDAIKKTIHEYPQIIDYFIKYKEDHGDDAKDLSALKVAESDQLYVKQFKQLLNELFTETGFYNVAGDTYEEAYARVMFLKDVIENKDGYRIFYVKGRPLERESDLQIMFRLTWFATPSDVNREVNNGRGPVDFKVSRGKRDSTLVEFKLAKNSRLRDNLQKQVEIYQKASDSKKAIKVILYFTDQEKQRAIKILDELQLTKDENIVLINARNDDKPSASKA